MKILYVVNARMPTEKAHGIQIAKMCEAFVAGGSSVTLVVPARTASPASVREFYRLAVDIPVVRLPILDTYRWGRAGFVFGSLSFMISSFFYVLSLRLRAQKFLLYTVDMDTFSGALLPYTGAPVISEMHTAKVRHLFSALFLRAVAGIVGVNRHVVNSLRERFPEFRAPVLVEPNGVDALQFAPKDKRAARARLHLPLAESIALYVGRFLDWKGLEVLPEAVAHAPASISWYLVGGTKEEFERVTGTVAPNSMHFVGSIPQSEVVWWISAADVLLVLGTARDAQSYSYTSPMKLFEYLLSRRTIVASKTPAICEIVSEREVLFCDPDSPQSLAAQVKRGVEQAPALEPLHGAAEQLGRQYSWSSRADRIQNFAQTVCAAATPANCK